MVKNEFGRIIYYNEQGQWHREDGPALEYEDGEKQWWFNDMRHRVDGPAIENANGDKFWYTNGVLHRADGPAMKYSSGQEYYLIMGETYSYEEWLAIKDFPLLW